MQYVWVILLFLPSALSQRFKVVVPDTPVVGVSGSEVVLSCSVRDFVDQKIRKNAVDMNVTWFRSDLGNSLVHLYGNHEDLNTGQNPFYRRRTAVFKEELMNGNASLKLSNVQISDEGEYRCRVDSTTWENYKTIKLSVEVMGSEPVITMEKYESEKFSLLCESKGWYPEPELQWRNSKGVILTAETETQAVDDFFNVKSRITVEKIDSFFCTVRRRHHEKEGLIDAHTLYELVPSEARKIVANAVVITIGLLLLVAVLAGVVFCYYKVKSLLNSDKDGRLQEHYLSPCQWCYVERTLLKSKEEQKEFNLRKYDPSDRGVKKLKKVIASSEKALLKQCSLTEKSCEVLASVLSSKNSLTELDLSFNRLEDSGVKKLCEGLKSEHCKLQRLRLKCCDLTKDICKVLASVIKSEISLTELDLSVNHLTDSGVKELCEGLKSSHCKLQNLRLDFCSLTEESCADLAEVLKSDSKLIELNLSINELKESGVKILCDGLKDENCKLQILSLEFCDLTWENCADLASVLKSDSKLIELNLNKNPGLKDLGVKNLCDGLKDKNCKLQKLRLEDCDLTGESYPVLAEVLKLDNSKLIELHLNNNTGLRDFSVNNLCDGLKNKNCKLKKLGLEFCFLTEESCAVLAEVLKSDSKLIELNLSKNFQLRNSGVKKLCDGLKDKNCKLQILRLAGCSITDKGCAVLASALKENPSSPLKELDLSSNQILVTEQKLFSELKDTFPNLKVKLDKCRITDKGCAVLTSALKENTSSPPEEQDLLSELNDTSV